MAETGGSKSRLASSLRILGCVRRRSGSARAQGPCEPEHRQRDCWEAGIRAGGLPTTREVGSRSPGASAWGLLEGGSRR